MPAVPMPGASGLLAIERYRTQSAQSETPIDFRYFEDLHNFEEDEKQLTSRGLQKASDEISIAKIEQIQQKLSNSQEIQDLKAKNENEALENANDSKKSEKSIQTAPMLIQEEKEEKTKTEVEAFEVIAEGPGYIALNATIKGQSYTGMLFSTVSSAAGTQITQTSSVAPLISSAQHQHFVDFCKKDDTNIALDQWMSLLVTRRILPSRIQKRQKHPKSNWARNNKRMICYSCLCIVPDEESYQMPFYCKCREKARQRAVHSFRRLKPDDYRNLVAKSSEKTVAAVAKSDGNVISVSSGIQQQSSSTSLNSLKSSSNQANDTEIVIEQKLPKLTKTLPKLAAKSFVSTKNAKPNSLVRAVAAQQQQQPKVSNTLQPQQPKRLLPPPFISSASANRHPPAATFSTINHFPYKVLRPSAAAAQKTAARIQHQQVKPGGIVVRQRRPQPAPRFLGTKLKTRDGAILPPPQQSPIQSNGPKFAIAKPPPPPQRKSTVALTTAVSTQPQKSKQIGNASCKHDPLKSVVVKSAQQTTTSAQPSISSSTKVEVVVVKEEGNEQDVADLSAAQSPTSWCVQKNDRNPLQMTILKLPPSPATSPSSSGASGSGNGGSGNKTLPTIEEAMSIDAKIGLKPAPLLLPKQMLLPPPFKAAAKCPPNQDEMAAVEKSVMQKDKADESPLIPKLITERKTAISFGIEPAAKSTIAPRNNNHAQRQQISSSAFKATIKQLVEGGKVRQNFEGQVQKVVQENGVFPNSSQMTRYQRKVLIGGNVISPSSSQQQQPPFVNKLRNTQQPLLTTSIRLSALDEGSAAKANNGQANSSMNLIIKRPLLKQSSSLEFKPAEDLRLVTSSTTPTQTPNTAVVASSMISWSATNPTNSTTFGGEKLAAALDSRKHLKLRALPAPRSAAVKRPLMSSGSTPAHGSAMKKMRVEMVPKRQKVEDVGENVQSNHQQTLKQQQSLHLALNNLVDELAKKPATTSAVHAANSSFQFKRGEVVWAKANQLPFWPGIIEDIILSERYPDQNALLVSWCGEKTYSEVLPDKVENFLEHFIHRFPMKSQNKSKKMIGAVVDAIAAGDYDQDDFVGMLSPVLSSAVCRRLGWRFEAGEIVEKKSPKVGRPKKPIDRVKDHKGNDVGIFSSERLQMLHQSIIENENSGENENICKIEKIPSSSSVQGQSLQTEQSQEKKEGNKLAEELQCSSTSDVNKKSVME